MELCLPSRFIWATRLPWSHQFKTERDNISDRTVTANANERAYRPTHTWVIQWNVPKNSNSPGAVSIHLSNTNGNWCTWCTKKRNKKNATVEPFCQERTLPRTHRSLSRSHFLPSNHGTAIISPPVTPTAVKLLLCFIPFLSSRYTWCQTCRDVKAPIQAEMFPLVSVLGDLTRWQGWRRLTAWKPPSRRTWEWTQET